MSDDLELLKSSDISPVSSSMTNVACRARKNAGRGVNARLRPYPMRPVNVANDAFAIYAAFEPLTALADNDFIAICDYLFGGDEPALPAVDAKTARRDLKARGIRPHIPSGKLYKFYGFGSLPAAIRCQLRHKGAVVVSMGSAVLVGVPEPTQLTLELAA